MANFFSKNILYLRKSKKLTQSESAIALDLKRNTISNYESGHSEPNIETILKIARHFSVSADDLMSIDLENVALSEKLDVSKIGRNVALKVAPSVALNAPKELKNNDIRIITF